MSQSSFEGQLKTLAPYSKAESIKLAREIYTEIILPKMQNDILIAAGPDIDELQTLYKQVFSEIVEMLSVELRSDESQLEAPQISELFRKFAKILKARTGRFSPS